MAEFEDLKSHEEIWSGFIRVTIWSSVVVAIALLAMRIFLV